MGSPRHPLDPIGPPDTPFGPPSGPPWAFKITCTTLNVNTKDHWTFQLLLLIPWPLGTLSRNQGSSRGPIKANLSLFDIALEKRVYRNIFGKNENGGCFTPIFWKVCLKSLRKPPHPTFCLKRLQSHKLWTSRVESFWKVRISDGSRALAEKRVSPAAF